MEIAPQIFTAKVMHKRLFPKQNVFNYRIYYIAMPLPATPLPSIVQTFPLNDLGYKDGRDLEGWVRAILDPYGLSQPVSEITVLAMPRVLGYVFNPVTFYLCLDEDKNLRAVVSEVHNTFGEHHSYLCAHPDNQPIKAKDWLDAEKLFHVSPFLERSGHYRFRFDVRGGRLGIWINYFDADNNRQLLTSLVGTLSPLTPRSLRYAFLSHPLVALKAMVLIHWQALKLVFKGIKYISKPKQRAVTLTGSSNLTKM